MKVYQLSLSESALWGALLGARTKLRERLKDFIRDALMVYVEDFDHLFPAGMTTTGKYFGAISHMYSQIENGEWFALPIQLNVHRHHYVWLQADAPMLTLLEPGLDEIWPYAVQTVSGVEADEYLSMLLLDKDLFLATTSALFDTLDTKNEGQIKGPGFRKHRHVILELEKVDG